MSACARQQQQQWCQLLLHECLLDSAGASAMASAIHPNEEEAVPGMAT